MRILLAGAAALAIASAGAYADPGKGKGNGNGNGGQQHAAAAAKPDRGNGNGNGNQGSANASSRADRSGPSQAAKPKARAADLRGSDGRSAGQPARQAARKAMANGNSRAGAVRAADTRDRDFIVRDSSRQLIAGCPPGLAKKGNGCLPPGQAKKLRSTGWHGYDYRPRLFGLNNYASGDYYYSNGYLLRPSGDGGIAGYIPLLGGALAVGNIWPSSYQSYSVPDYYVDYYDLGPERSYRYADNVIYRVDPGDAAIASVAALLTGDDFAVGQPMPSGYDVYNVPYSYRDRYADTNDAWYRYSDGYVYRVDPETQLVAAAIDLLI